VRILRPLLTGALVAGALTGLGPSAYAGTGTSTYSCDFPVLGAVDVPMAATIPDLSNLPAGTSVPAGSFDLDRGACSQPVTRARSLTWRKDQSWRCWIGDTPSR